MEQKSNDSAQWNEIRYLWCSIHGGIVFCRVFNFSYRFAALAKKKDKQTRDMSTSCHSRMRSFLPSKSPPSHHFVVIYHCQFMTCFLWDKIRNCCAKKSFPKSIWSRLLLSWKFHLWENHVGNIKCVRIRNRFQWWSKQIKVLSWLLPIDFNILT